MTFDDDFWRALQDYTLKFPDIESLGTGTPPTTWLTERTRVQTTARASILITQSASEGASGTGQRQFDQAKLVDALDYRRHQLDAAYPLQRHLRRNTSAPVILTFRPCPTGI
jgi:hypothetical protein